MWAAAKYLRYMLEKALSKGETEKKQSSAQLHHSQVKCKLQLGIQKWPWMKWQSKICSNFSTLLYFYRYHNQPKYRSVLGRWWVLTAPIIPWNTQFAVRSCSNPLSWGTDKFLLLAHELIETSVLPSLFLSVCCQEGATWLSHCSWISEVHGREPATQNRSKIHPSKHHQNPALRAQGSCLHNDSNERGFFLRAKT